MKVMGFSVFAVGAKLNQELVAKFKAADINHDSKLIPAEVQAYMPMVANPLVILICKTEATSL
jgi:hypothetical protein